MGELSDRWEIRVRSEDEESMRVELTDAIAAAKVVPTKDCSCPKPDSLTVAQEVSNLCGDWAHPLREEDFDALIAAVRSEERAANAKDYNDMRHFQGRAIAAESKVAELQAIIDATLREVPVGNVKNHGPQFLARDMKYWVSEAARLSNENEKLEEATDWMFKDIADYEQTVGYKVNFAFQTGWQMARSTNAILEKLAGRIKTIGDPS